MTGHRLLFLARHRIKQRIISVSSTGCYANQENHLFAMHGVEGKDWNWNEDGEVERTM